MRQASLVIASLLVVCACGGGKSPDGGKTVAERFPVPDDLAGTNFVLECSASKTEVRNADGAIAWIEDEFLADPQTSDASRDYYKKKLPGMYGERAAYIAANPNCFGAARLMDAHKFIDAAKRQYGDWRTGDPA